MTAQRRRPTALVVSGVFLLTLPGCSDSGTDAPVAVVQARVTAKEKALTDAQATATAASAAFCTASVTYVKAIDRYGDVLMATAPTVGDVKDAGSDIEQPSQDAQEAATAVTESRQAVAAAEQELADAEAAPAPGPGLCCREEPIGSGLERDPQCLPHAAQRDRGAAGEGEFAAAQAGISDNTPLALAAEQFNAAAVALEMAWLQLLGDSGCLTDAQQAEAAAAVEGYTTALQQALADVGYYDGKVDGVYGPETVAAIESLQKANGLPQTGTLDKATEKALRTELAAKGGAAAQDETASTAAVQQTLKLAGYWDGPVDGVWSDALTDALEELQKDLGVPVTGTVDAATIAAFEKAVAEVRTPQSPGPSPSVTSPAPSVSS